MAAREITLVCRYPEEGRSAAQIIQSSFDVFLKKELSHVEDRPPPYSRCGPGQLPSGGAICARR